MKTSTFLAFLVFSVLGFCQTLTAQKITTPQVRTRCATMERLSLNYTITPGLKAAADKASKIVPTGTQTNYRTQAVVTVPVIVHIVLPNPFVVTDQDVQSQISRLNLDFAGLNPDSTNVPAAFAALRGHSQIQFCMARRSPTGQITNGIERRASSAGSDVTVAVDPIKRTSLGGLDVWNPDQYLNLWIGQDVSGQGILGYAQFPGSGPAADDGVFLNFQSFGENTCNNIGIYNRGRTGSHEVGHYFGLYHIWGDESGCAQSDFRTLPGAGCVSSPSNIPASLFGSATDQTIGDTPNQGNATTNCPAGTATDACAAAAPGKMYQNYMDYTADNCYSMFTIKQVQRMEWVLDSCRSGLKTSLGCQAPASAVLWDALPSVSVNPGGFELNGCAVTTYTDAFSCPGNLSPKFMVRNNGLNTITSLTVGYRLDNGAAVTQTATLNLVNGASTMVSFAPVAVPVGNHTFKFFTSQPNGNADQAAANDTLVQTFRVMAPVNPPLTEGFDNPAPFVSFAIDNPNGDVTWTRTTPGRGASTGKLTMDNYNIDNTGTFDDFRSAAITVTPTSSYTLSFDVAHKYYNATGAHDTLSVYVSTNCGQSYTRVYQKWGPTLAGTAGFSNAAYTTPAAADWRTEVIPLSGSLISSGQIVVMFRNSGRFGNFIHLDNINLSQNGGRDLRLVSINSPGTASCSSNIAPTVTVANDGTETVTSFNLGFRIDNGANSVQNFTTSIAPGATANFTLGAASTTSGAHTLTAFTADPVSASGTGDIKKSNDTLTKAFTVVSLVTPPVVEGFEGAFPPPGWSIFNPNNNGTWEQRSPGRNSDKSAFIDNYTVFGLTGQIDEMRSPFINVAGADSVIVTFDVAHRNYPGANDTLRVLTTGDCGTSFTSVYGKAGATLATGPSSTASFVAPTAAQWRNERISLGGPLISTGSLGVNFRNRNAFGNNIFIDNINISPLFKRDLELVSINGVTNLVCAATLTPTVTVRNNGLETVTAFNIAYSINGGALQNVTITGITLARDAQMTVTLPVINTATPGVFRLQIYSLQPITASGTGDMRTFNDTLVRTYSVPGSATAPLTESFTGTTFPPANWGIGNPDNGITWSRSNLGNGNVGSAFVNTFNYNSNGQKDDLATPKISFGTPDSVRLSFDLSAVTFSYPGSTALNIDTLEVLLTRDCGNTFTSVYKKWGTDLQTVNDPNSPQTGEYFPLSSSQWRTEQIDLSAFAGQSPLQVVFRVTNNSENNIFIDNVNFSTQTLPDQLKQSGYLVLPTAFQNSFRIWHFQNPTTLRYVNVVNAAGQLVYTRQFSNGADRQMTVDLSGKAAGVYFVKIGYADASKNIVQRVIKL